MAQSDQSNNSSFATQHLSMIFKYIGISFVAGAVSHGVFTGSRSLITAGLGVVMFLIGQWIEYRQSGGTGGKAIWQTLLVGAVLAIGMGFFTGSLQHFPDSPARSVWVVPIGFAMTLAALGWMNREKLTGTFKRYAAASLVTVSAISLGAYQFFAMNPMEHDHGGHSHEEVASAPSTPTTEHQHNEVSTSAPTATHDHASMDMSTSTNNAGHDHASMDMSTPTTDNASHDHAAMANMDAMNSGEHDHSTHEHGNDTAAIGQPGEVNKVDRVINITMDDTMRYQPSNIAVQENETVRFVIENKGKVKHELTLGDPTYLKDHAAKMLKFPNMQHNDPNMVALEAGAKGEIIWQFTKAGTVDFACLQPGHFEAGMRGAVVVKKNS